MVDTEYAVLHTSGFSALSRSVLRKAMEGNQPITRQICVMSGHPLQ
jgi:hypothetical protein